MKTRFTAKLSVPTIILSIIQIIHAKKTKKTFKCDKNDKIQKVTQTSSFLPFYSLLYLALFFEIIRVIMLFYNIFLHLWRFLSSMLLSLTRKKLIIANERKQSVRRITHSLSFPSSSSPSFVCGS